MTGPHRLRTEHLGDRVLGIATARPRLSWWLPVDVPVQAAYEVERDGGITARVVSAAHVLVPWPFQPLRSRERAHWRVRVWSTGGDEPSAWSRWASVEAGLLEPRDWSASWIEPDEGPPAPPGERPAWVLRRSFELESLPAVARLHATAHGIYEAALNGVRIGDLELTPGFTSYATNLQVQTYDVGDHLITGENVLEVTLSDGWYRGKHGNSQHADGFGERVAFLGQLEVDGVRVVTDGTWMAATGPIRCADLMAGQVEDRRRRLDACSGVLIADHGFEQLSSSPSPPVRAVEEVRPTTITRIDRRTQVVDLGQNITGRVRLRRLGPSGSEVVLRHGEALDGTGRVTTEHLEPATDALGQVDRVVSGGAEDEPFEPRHTVHGFQFVQVEGLDEPLRPDDVTGVVVHTDLTRTGWFRCSDERLNRLHEMADWSFRGNACDIPTDCPHRERSGWTGDWQVFQPAAAFLYDVAGFSTKWLRDLAAEQRPDGLVANYAPDPRLRRVEATGDLSWYGMQGSAGWGDAAVLVPWDLYRLYGDEAVLAEMWPMMCGWLDYAAHAARTRRHPARSERRPEPLPHEQFLWDGGWHWGEWCEPDTGGEPFYSADQGHVATAYLHHTAAIATRIARLLDDEVRVDRFETLAAGALGAWRAEYLAPDGSVAPDSQANLVRALAFGLVPPELRTRTADRLVELVRAAGDHVGTGFLATPLLLPVLADTGHLDVAYDVLLQDTPPSWLTMVERGATTIWEEWEGIDADGVAHASLNHYSKGAVISFLHRYVAGLQPVDGEPAYRRFRVAPQPGAGITAAEAQFDSPSGRIEIAWRTEGPVFHLDLVVPSGTSAEVLLPDGAERTVGPGRHEATATVP